MRSQSHTIFSSQLKFAVRGLLATLPATNIILQRAHGTTLKVSQAVDKVVVRDKILYEMMKQATNPYKLSDPDDTPESFEQLEITESTSRPVVTWFSYQNLLML